MTRSKRCIGCQLEKVFSEFYRSSHGGYQPRCKQCCRTRSRESFKRRYKGDEAFRVKHLESCYRRRRENMPKWLAYKRDYYRRTKES